MLEQAHIYKKLVNEDIWGEWTGYQIPISDTYVCIWTPIGTPMYWKPGTWISQKHTVAYFWPDQWYTMHVGYHEDGGFASGYCDVILPMSACTGTSKELTYIDLYIDVVIREDHAVFTKDQEVFERAAKRYPIVEASRQKSFETLDWLEEQARNWTGPFSVMPRHLPRTDFQFLDAKEARDGILSVL